MESSWGDQLVIFLLLAVLALIIIAPLVFVFFIAIRIRNSRTRLGFVLASLAAPFVILYFTGYMGSSAARVHNEHAVMVPPSASNFQCDPLFATSIFLDEGAEASFEMSRQDLPIFLNQLKGLRKRKIEPDANDNMQHHDVPERFGQVITTFDGFAHNGNPIHIDVYDMTEAKVGVWIATISN